VTTRALPFADPAAFSALPRITGLAVAPDGRRLVATVESPDAAGASYVSALWEIDIDGRDAPRRLTWSDKGESAPAFLADGTLLFVSARADDEASVWALPPGGEAQPFARYPGGTGGPVAAAGAAAALLRASRPVGSDGDGHESRTRRKERKITAIVHTGMPIRSWDHEVGDVSPRLLLARPGDEAPSDLAADALFELLNATYDLSADAGVAATTWSQRRPGGRSERVVAVIDTRSGRRQLLDPGDGADVSDVRMSPDGRRLAAAYATEGDFDTIMTAGVRLLTVDGDPAAAVEAELGEVFPTGLCWSPDGEVLFVSGDWRGRGAVLAIDPTTGRVRHRLAADAVYTSLVASPDGRAVCALRSTVEQPPTPVRLDPSAEDQQPTPLPSPVPAVELPGALEEIEATGRGGTALRAWLCVPPPGDRPAPVMLWIHGGPFSSWNAWSWRWNPWVAVAHGWAVVLPDPALSTGYGPEWFSRAWPHRAQPVWEDAEAVLDAALARPDLDASRTACLGGSFGGYMTNWIAGHTDRFAAIVTHAGLWALDQQHTTTDNAAWKTGLFGTPAEHPEWYAANSPHHTVDRIHTPMLVVHGNRDYRVPVSEALRLWWDLVSRHQGDPGTLPHRFLQFTGENHWVLTPANAEIWYETVLGFCAEHVLGARPQRSVIL
jgi:dipeptidyl aminopeptidase/acylaminoacyl peptidase